MLPEIIGCDRQYTEDTTRPIVGVTRCEEAVVTTVMLDQKQAHEKPCGWNCEEQAQPDAVLHGHPTHCPERCKWQCGEGQLHKCAAIVGRAIFSKAVDPADWLWGKQFFYVKQSGTFPPFGAEVLCV
jgi:hypothetical protein